MEVQPLVDTYQRYKAGTQKLIKWLVNNAKPASPQSVAAKKLSRQATSTSSARSVSVDELVRLAIQIVSADPKIDIPIDIINVTYDVIKGRSWSCDWYSALTKKDKAHQTEEVKQSNSRHRYFLNILKEIYQLLSKEAKARRPKRKKKLELATDRNDLNNLFLHLELEDPAIVEDSLSSDTPAAKPASKVKPAAEDIKIQGIEENGEEEELFALYCHLQDLFELRLQHRKVWQDYLTGRLSFMTACQVFDQAVAIADMLATRFAAAHPNLHSFDAIVHRLGGFSYVTQARISQGLESFLHFQEVATQLPDTHDMALNQHPQFLMMPAWCALQDVRELCKYIDSNKQQYGQAMPTSIFGGHPFAKHLLQMTADLRPLFANLQIDECCVECKERTSNAYSDMLSRQLTRTMHFESLNTSVLVGTTMYMDMHDILEGDLERGTREAEPFMEQLRATSADLQNFYDDPVEGAQKYMHPVETKIYESTANMFCISQDAVKPSWRINQMAHLKNLEKDPDGWRNHKTWAGIVVPLNVLQTLPVFPAQTANMIMHLSLTMGAAIASRTGIVLAAAHLHSAAKLIGASSQSWDDMEFVVQRENEVVPFLARGDGTLHGAAKQFCLALGLKVSQVAGKARVVLPNHGRDIMKITSISRFVPESAKDMTKCGSRHRKQKTASTTLTHKGHVDLSRLYSALKQYANSHGIEDPTIAKQWKDTRKLSPSQLLALSQEILVGDELYLHFDMIQFYMRTVRLMYQIEDAYYSHSSSKRKSQDSNFTNIVNEILWDASAVQSRNGDMTKTVLYEAGQIIDTAMPEIGSICITKAREMSSGFLPDHLKPSALYGPKAVMRPKSAPLPQTLTVQTSMRGLVDLMRPGMLESGLNIDLAPQDKCTCCVAKAGIKLYTKEQLQAE